MKEAQRIYNLLTVDTKTTEDHILLANDLYTVLLLVVNKALASNDDEKNSLMIDSIKSMTNSYMQKLMKTVTDKELTTTENKDG